MNVHVRPAHVASLHAILCEVVVPPTNLAEPVREVFEAEIRQAITDEALAFPTIDEGRRQHLEDVAWMAFDRRLERHEWSSALGGKA